MSRQVTEGRPDGTGVHTAKVLAEVGIPCTLVLDSAVAYMMDRVDMVRERTQRGRRTHTHGRRAASTQPAQ